MKTQLEKVSELKRKLSVEIPAEVVKTTFERYFKNVQKDANIKGFRKGKAPLQTIKSVYGDKIRYEVANELLQMGFSKGLKEHSLTPVNYPHFEFEEVKEETGFSFSADFEVSPEVQLKKYEGLAVQKEKFTFDDSEVEKILTNIRKSRAQNVPVLEDRPAQLNDVAVIDFEGFIDSAPLEGGKGENFSLELGSKSFIEGFEEGVVGMKVGGKKTLQLKFPENYQATNIAGKSVEFHVTLKSLNKKELPELNDEFVKSLGGIESVDHLKEDIKKDIEQSEKRRIESEFKDRLFKALVELNPVEVPVSLMEQQKEGIIKDFEKRMKEQGMSEEEFKEYVQKWDKEFEQNAKEILQAAYITSEIAKKHELHAKKEDIDEKITEYAKSSGIEESRVREHFLRAEYSDRFIHGITEDKVFQFLVTKANVSEVSKDQLKDKKAK